MVSSLSMDSIFADASSAPLNINEVLEDSDREEKRPKKKALEEVKEDDLEISDQEAPDVDQAKQNLRK